MPGEAPFVIQATHIPATLEQALDRAWLRDALAPVSGGAAIDAVEIVEVIRTMATKVRFTVRFNGPPPEPRAFCLKAFLDMEDAAPRGGGVTLREANFYQSVAPAITVRTPTCVSTIINRDTQDAVIIMRDLIADGARFCTALEALSADQAAQSLEQIARLHVSRSLLDRCSWINSRVATLGGLQHVTPAMLQALLDGPRGEGLPPRTRDAAVLLAAMKALAVLDAQRPQTLVHGDCHAGNLYWTGEGPGLIDWQLLQSGNWSLDVAYHICAVLTVETAEREERNLLNHYRETVRRLGGEVAAPEVAWEQYRASALYGYYLWSITRRVDPAITNVFVNRLGSAVMRHESHRLLGV